MNSRQIVRRLAAMSVLALCGCAGAPPAPDHSVAEAGQAVASAEDARAADYAPDEMHAAHEKLKEARALARQSAADPKDPNAVKARRLAEEAAADAELAKAKALNTRMQSVLRQMQQTPAVPPPANGN
jgi:hypothetical protein